MVLGDDATRQTLIEAAARALRPWIIDADDVGIDEDDAAAVATAVVDALPLTQVGWYSPETVRQWKPGSTASGYLAFLEEYDEEWPGLVPVFAVQVETEIPHP